MNDATDQKTFLIGNQQLTETQLRVLWNNSHFQRKRDFARYYGLDEQMLLQHSQHWPKRIGFLKRESNLALPESEEARHTLLSLWWRVVEGLQESTPDTPLHTETMKSLSAQAAVLKVVHAGLSQLMDLEEPTPIETLSIEGLSLDDF